MEMFACNSDKEQIVNDIKELKQQIILIVNKLDELRVFYITNKGKYDHELARTFFKNLQDFINKERIKDLADLPIESWGLKDPYFINYYSDANIKIINRYYDYSQCANNHNIRTNNLPLPNGLPHDADKLFNFICNEEEDKLIHKMLMFEKKLKYNENRLMRLYPDPEKPEIKNIMDMYPDYEEHILVKY
jgi:hypothetical protein